MLVALALAVSACGGSGNATKSDHSAAGGSAAPTTASAKIPTPGASTHVHARGGGDFCKLIADATNQASVAGTSSASIKADLTKIRGQEAQALQLAPSSLTSDVTLLFHASNKIYDALGKVGYDYSKLKASDMSPLRDPDVVAAEKRLKAYVDNTCKLG